MSDFAAEIVRCEQWGAKPPTVPARSASRPVRTIIHAAFAQLAGANENAGVFGQAMMLFPNYTGGAAGTSQRSFTVDTGTVGQSAANHQVDRMTANYRSTSAITRIAVAPNTGGAKLKVGSRLLIYAR